MAPNSTYHGVISEMELSASSYRFPFEDMITIACCLAGLNIILSKDETQFDRAKSSRIKNECQFNGTTNGMTNGMKKLICGILGEDEDLEVAESKADVRAGFPAHQR
jgi:hypothetical protein